MMERSKTSSGSHAGPRSQSYQPVRAPRGSQTSCPGWPQEAALRMLMNSLDEEVAEKPRELIACGATGTVLHDWDCYHTTVEALKSLKNDETLLVLSGKPMDVFGTNDSAPRVLIANSNPSGRWPAGDASHELEQSGLAAPSQAVAASWTYVGTQGELQTAFQTFDAVGRKHFGGDLAGKLIVSGGMGAAGGALPLAAGMLGAAFLGIEVDEEKIKRRIRAGFCDYCVNTLDEALRILKNAVRQKHAVAVGLVGNCADAIPELAGRGVVPDILTDQTSAHDLLHGYVPSGLNAEEAAMLRRENSGEYLSRARHSIARHFGGMLALQKLGSVVFEFGNRIQAVAHKCGVEGDFAFPDFAEAYLRPLLSEGRVPVRWVALSGEPGDIRRFDDLALELFSNDAIMARWIPLARKFVRFQGLPARVCWLGPEARIVLAGHVNRLVGEGAIKAPIVIALDQMKRGTEASLHAKSEEIKGGIDATRDRPLLNALLNTASGASWISLASGSGHCQATVVLVADGTPKAAEALPRVLKNDYALRIARLAAAGLQKLRDTLPRAELHTPMPEKP
jgi:urocanate hydratase